MDRSTPLSVRLNLLAGIILAPMTLTSAGVIPAIRFTRERIEITVRPEAIDVDGTYVYANPMPIPWSQGLRIPFSVDASHPAPATVRVTEMDPHSGRELRAIGVRWVWGEPHFSVRVSAFGTTYVRVRFTQLSTTHSATYLLTTAKPWGRPLDRGEYLLRPRAVRIAASNYPFDRRDCFCFVRERFTPDREWTLTWIPE